MSSKDSEKEEKSTQGKEASSPEAHISAEELEALKARVTELEAMREKMVRSAADFENAKKRLIREKEEFAKYAQENLLRDLLPILDNLERALAHSKEDESTLKQVVRGVEMVAKQFLDTMKKEGLERFKSQGEMFDPHRHEILTTEAGEGKDHEILQEIEPGYLLHGRVLRAAKVKVRVLPNETSSDQP